MFLAIECGSTKKNAIIRYCAKTKDSAVSIVGPAWTAITETMPPDMRPEKGRNEYEWVFPKTGAKFVLFGTDAQSFAKGRGPRTDLQFFDECGFYQDLESVENALLPALQTTNGKALYLSTPSETLAHPYIQRIYAASASQRLQHATLYENSRINPELIIAGEASRLGMSVEDFKNSTYFKREFLAQLVQEESTAGFPSFTIESAKRLVQEFQMPKMYDGYVAIDVGLTNDPHAALFAVHDWESDKLLIVDEVELRSDASTLKTLSEALKEKEKFYFGTDRWNGTLLGLKDHYKVVNEAPFYLKDLIFQEAPKNPYLRCVAEGSLVLMADGSHRPIEHVKVGDFVHTRQGAKRVSWAGLTGENRKTLTLKTALGELHTTPDHRIATPDGWKELESLAIGDKVVGCTISQSSKSTHSLSTLNGEDSVGAEMSTLNSQGGGSITFASKDSKTDLQRCVGFIERFGEVLTGTFRRITSFTTKTRTPSTTTSPISNASPEPLTFGSIWSLSLIHI